MLEVEKLYVQTKRMRHIRRTQSILILIPNILLHPDLAEVQVQQGSRRRVVEEVKMHNRHNSNYSNNISIVNSNLRLVMPLLNPNERCLNVRISIISMTASFRSTSFSSRSFFIVLIVFVFLWYLQFDLLNVIFFIKKTRLDSIRFALELILTSSDMVY